ncbi:uncharacterized protein LOC116205986 isoform X2 [Punica granatum]|uniref:Uncharacterized protein LOC116205986 isoform X2 n=1 Tax=Punica granatum TaxID=22663 RepID=A0A6P8DDB9_PUNGR|nr:uncharacterized protein LOC116205986 isoform X2 [Punica granatum]
MDTALPTSTSHTPFCFNNFSFANYHRLLKIKPPQLHPHPNLNKLRTSSAPVSVSASPSDCSSSSNFPSNPFWALLRILGNFRSSASSQAHEWASCIRAYGESTPAVTGGYGSEIVRNGGIGAALLSVTSSAKVKISPFVATLAANPTFVSALFAWCIAQSIKVILNFFVEKKWDLRILFASGGMPSSHSALCTALTTSVALCHGVADSLFPVCLGFSSIVMYDAIGVRRHAGMQAEFLWVGESANCLL